MSTEEQYREAVQEFFELLLPTADTVIRSVRSCMLKVAEDGYTLPIHAVGAAMALVTYQVIQGLQGAIQSPDGGKHAHGDITGVFVDSVINLISCDYGLLTLTMTRKHLEVLRSLVHAHRNDADTIDVVPQLLKMFEYADATWATMLQRRVEMEKIYKEAAQAQLQ